MHDVDAAVRFYTEFLDFDLEEHMGTRFAVLAYGDLQLWLSGPGSSAMRAPPGGSQPEPGGWNRLVIELPDIEPVISKLLAAHVPFRSAILSGPGGRQVVCEDPSGNPIELFQPA
ncbi:MAG TPA: VOC family protein [Tepidiformaceae bacterium]|nr:VOC family protein [Tepidiformaceae bacterium]HMO96124.1 VOC family protein [Tepidiformaceae bacterium]